MKSQFQFSRLPSIYFGRGRVSMLPSLSHAYGCHILLVTGKESFIGSPAGESLLQSFHDHYLKVTHVDIQGEPSPAIIDKTVDSLRDTIPDVVIAAGGGSALDAGKAISAMLLADEPVVHYLEGIGNREHNGRKVPFIAVPTTSGTGSEATKNAVLSETGLNGFKRSLRHENFVPDIAIVDPDLTLTCPPALTANCGMDCFSQLVEAYLSVKASEYTDSLALSGIKAVKESLLKAFSIGSDHEARTGMSFAALTSGIVLANAGLGTVHGFASSVGARMDIPHGVICGSMMAACNEMTLDELRKEGARSEAMFKYITLGKIFCEKAGQPDDYYADFFIETLYEYTSMLKIPKLGEFGLQPEDVPGIAASTDNKNNPVKFSQDHLSEIILKCV